MSAAYLNVLPFVILNLGGEMIYILDQRLRAQEIGQERSQKVLQDVVKTMLSRKFVEELFRPQEMYSMVSTRQIFEKLAHSSIMKLNATSMSKLFDLMLMGVKYQVLSIASPDELYSVTLTHLQSIGSLLQKGSPSEQLVSETTSMFKSLAQTFRAYDYMIVRQQLCKFFQDRHVKVSLFIQDGIQGLDGTIFLNFAQEGVIFGHRPGDIKIYNGSTHTQQEKKIQLLHSQHWKANPLTKRLGGTTTPYLGTNMYEADRTKPPVPLKIDDPKSSQQQQKISKQQLPQQVEEQKQEQPSSKSEAAMEFNQLANLIGLAADETRSQEEDFKINLFPETVSASIAASGDRFGANKDPNVIEIDLGKTSSTKEQVKKAMKDFGDMDLASSAQQANTGDDLLDLMDSF